MIEEKQDYEKSVFLSDIHVPYQDPKAVKIAYEFIREFEPDHVFLVGDIIDFCQVSKFDKDPARLLEIQKDIDGTISLLSDLRTSAPKAKITYIKGNHENRMMRYLWQHPEISSLRALTLSSLLELHNLDISFHEANESLAYHGFLIEHGDVVRKHSGYTARAMMEKRGCLGISGHTHRLGTHYYTMFRGDHVWLENGCLCDRKPKYMFGSPNWQQGFSIGWFRKNRFTVEQVCICKGKMVWGGREYVGDNTGDARKTERCE